MSRVKDLSGQRFGLLVAIKKSGTDSKGRPTWLCKCDCGKEAVVCQYYLSAGETKSCGCLAPQKRDLQGQRFGRLSVIEKANNNRFGQSRWKCKCDCGALMVVDQRTLITGQAKGCGSGNCKSNFVDISGHRFGRLLVIKYDGSDFGRGAKWLCQCDCGQIKSITAKSLRRGLAQSCGCLSKEIARSVCIARNYKHGLHSSKEYKTWAKMKERCTNPNASYYEFYGGRGIMICDRWLGNFIDFFEDMGKAPGREYSIDRIDNNGHYSCGACDQCRANGWVANCRWATQKQQARNTSRNRWITFNGETKTIAQWGEETGIAPMLIHQRIKKLGWSIEKALTTPIRRQRAQSQTSKN